jgi:hypothetical protein
MAQQQPDGPVLRRVIAHVELVSEADKRAKVQRFRESPWSRRPEELGRIERSILDPAMYGMTVMLAADLDDGRRVTARGFGFGGPRKRTGRDSAKRRCLYPEEAVWGRVGVSAIARHSTNNSDCGNPEKGQAHLRQPGYQVNSISNSVWSSSTSNSIFRATSSGTFATNLA